MPHPVPVGTLAVTLFAGIGASQSCGTTVSGTVAGTWTAAGSPYCVTADVVVNANLRIEAGVIVRFAAGRELRVRGTLTATGTDAAPVTFERDDPSRSWAGIVLTSTAGSSALDHAVIRGADSAGLTIEDCTPTIADSTIADCTSAATGGGIDIALTSGALTIVGCRIEQCSSDTAGGGIRAVLQDADLTLDRCELRGNSANPTMAVRDARGGGLYVQGGNNITITNCEFTDNRCLARNPNAAVTAAGGAVFVTGAVRAVFADCFVADNSCSADGTNHNGCDENVRAEGAGVCLVDTDAAMRRCFVLNNEANAVSWASFPGYSICWPTSIGEGGGIRSQSSGAARTLWLYNCVFAANAVDAVAGSYSAVALPVSRGAVVSTNGVRLVGTNCTIAEHLPTAGRLLDVPTGFAHSIRNSVVANNSPRALPTVPQLAVRYSLIEGGYPGEGNIDNAPAFVAAASTCGRLELSPASPTVDAGDPDPEYDDVAFPPSIGGARNDMGAQGGPLAAGWANWERARPTLDVSPRAACAAATARLAIRGGAVHQPVGLFVAEIAGVPLAGGPAWLPVPMRFCAAGRAQLNLPVPAGLCSTAPSVGFQAFSLDSAGRLVASNVATW
ncbi:MAG: right-handed parallel beta-helix repeat-containing protein [Planctomycetota bacterium]